MTSWKIFIIRNFSGYGVDYSRFVYLFIFEYPLSVTFYLVLFLFWVFFQIILCSFNYSIYFYDYKWKCWYYSRVKIPKAKKCNWTWNKRGNVPLKIYKNQKEQDWNPWIHSEGNITHLFMTIFLRTTNYFPTQISIISFLEQQI